MAVAEQAAEALSEPQAKRLGVFNQLFRFLGVGGICAILDASVYALMLSLGQPNWLSRSSSFVVGTSASYVINRKLTFRNAGTGNAKVKALAFGLVYLVTYFVNTGTNQALYLSLPDFGFPNGDVVRYATCWVIGQGLGTMINFVMLKWVVFRD